MHSTVSRIVELFEARGQLRYSGEYVSQLEHALQTAALAEAENVPRHLIAAALLHDIGHLLTLGAGTPKERGHDDRHERRAFEELRGLWGDEVLGPIRLHVDAKRYLCFARPDYFESLSADSQRSLTLQGGLFSATAAADFLQEPFAADAIRLRLWDDAAKVRDLRTPELRYFVPVLESCLAARD